MIKDIKSLFQDYLHVALGRAIGSGIIQFLSLLLIVRILSPEGYGSYVLFVSVALITATLTTWTSASIVRFGREEFIAEGSIRKTFWANYWILLPVFALCYLIVFFLRDELSQYIGITQNCYYLIFSYILLSNLSLNIPIAFQAMGKMKHFSYLPLAFSGAFLAALAVIHTWIPLVAVDLILVMLILGHLLVVTIGLSLLWKNITPVCFPKEWMRKCFSYSWPLALGGSGQQIVQYMDQLVIGMFMATAFVGVYNVAYLLQDYLIAIPALSVSLMFPLMTSLIVNKEENKIAQYIKVYAPQIVFFWALAVSIFIVFAPQILWLFGPAYTNAFLPFTILLVCVAFRILPIIEAPVLASHGLIKEAVSINIAIVIVNLGLDFLLIPRMGISGAAVATVIAFVIGALGRTFVLHRRLGINNFGSYIWLFPVIVSFIGSNLTSSLTSRALFVVVVIIASLYIAKMSNTFNKESLEVLDSITMPNFIRRVIRKVYTLVA